MMCAESVINYMAKIKESIVPASVVQAGMRTFSWVWTHGLDGRFFCPMGKVDDGHAMAREGVLKLA